jgi:hypothetical protein
MTTTAGSLVQAAAVVSVVLVGAVAAFQVALAAGLPLGGAVLGGRAAHQDGVLTRSFRVLALLQAAGLVLVGWLLAARAGLVPIPMLGGPGLVRATWLLVVLLALNTSANLGAPHPVERWVMGSTTLALAALALLIALRAPVPA